MGVPGGQSFIFTRKPLKNNVLNLAEYFGYQEIDYRKDSDNIIESVEFDFNCVEDAYLYFIFGKTNTGFHCFRFSTWPQYKNAVLTADYKMQFIDRQEINIPKIEPHSWYHIKADFQNNGCRLHLDGQTEYQFYNIIYSDSNPDGNFSGQKFNFNRKILARVMQVFAVCIIYLIAYVAVSIYNKFILRILLRRHNHNKALLIITYFIH